MGGSRALAPGYHPFSDIFLSTAQLLLLILFLRLCVIMNQLCSANAFYCFALIPPLDPPSRKDIRNLQKPRLA